MSEADTRAKLIDPAIHARGWAEDLIRREERGGGDRDRRRQGAKAGARAGGLHPACAGQPAVAARRGGADRSQGRDLSPVHGLEQGKAYANARRLNVPFVFASNGHLFVEYDRLTGLTAAPRPLSAFPMPDDLRARYETGMGFRLTDPAAAPLLAPYSGGEGGRRYYQDACST